MSHFDTNLPIKIVCHPLGIQFQHIWSCILSEMDTFLNVCVSEKQVPIPLYLLHIGSFQFEVFACEFSSSEFFSTKTLMITDIWQREVTCNYGKSPYKKEFKGVTEPLSVGNMTQLRLSCIIPSASKTNSRPNIVLNHIFIAVTFFGYISDKKQLDLVWDCSVNILVRCVWDSRVKF